jgi:glycosyltransferase involved in cell wall biosynthesis
MNIDDFVKQLNSVINSGPVTTNVSAPVLTNTIHNEPVSNGASNAVKVDKKLKIMIVSTHINQVNAYSKNVYNIINQLSACPWLSVVHFASQKVVGGDIGRKYPINVKVIDATALEKQKNTGFAFAELPGIINSEKPDVLLIYNDIAIVCGYIEEIRKAIESRFFRIWAYVNLVYKTPTQNMIDILNRDVERVFCYTKGWKEQLKLSGITRPVDVMNNGINATIIRQIPRDLARQTLGLPKDAFLFTSFNRNIPRKRLDILIMSFVKLIARFPMKSLFLLIVADKGDKGGFQLFEIFARELKLAGLSADGFGNRLLLAASNAAYKDEDINMLYNCGNVGISCAEGDGFGLCSFEQMYLGIPQIVPNITGYSEYCNESNSMMITPKLRYYLPSAYHPTGGEAQMLDPEDVAKAMERYAFDEDLCKLHGKLAKEKVSEYTWSKCCSTLIKRLQAVLEDDD